VPDEAEIWYYLRGRDRTQVDDLRRRVRLCARGAAIATETRWSMTLLTCITERLGNETMASLMDAVLRRCGAPRLAPAETRAARKLARGATYKTTVDPVRERQGRGSSDEDNVSWFAPLGRVSVACVPEGTVGHHRSYAAMARLNGALRGMTKAGEVLALAAVELAANPPLLRSAREDFRRARRGKSYRLPLPPGAKPPPYAQ